MLVTTGARHLASQKPPDAAVGSGPARCSADVFCILTVFSESLFFSSISCPQPSPKWKFHLRLFSLLIIYFRCLLYSSWGFSSLAENLQ